MNPKQTWTGHLVEPLARNTNA